MIGADQTSKAAHEARVWLKKYPNDPDGLLVLGQVAVLNGDFVASQKFINAAFKANPLYRNVAYGWINEVRYILSKHPNLRLGAVRVVPSQSQNQSAALQKRAQSLLMAKKYDEIERLNAQMLASRAQIGASTWQLAAFAAGLWEQNSEVGWQNNHPRLQNWLKARPKSLLARVAVARSWTTGAWMARGDGYASSISPSMSRLLNARLKSGGAVFSTLWPSLEKSPLVWSGLQRYYLLKGPPGAKYWSGLKRADAAFPGYGDFWQNATTLLLPRWYGKAGDWERLAKSAADKLGGARGDALYAEIVAEKSQGYPGNYALYFQASWPRIKRGMQILLKTQRDPVGFGTSAFNLAIGYEDFAFAQQMLLGPLKGHFCTSIFPSTGFARTRIFALKNGRRFA